MEDTTKLKPKDECEQQLAVELALGVVNNINDLIDQKHIIACEYACQLLFDNLRKKVATQSELPARIVNHLFNDRCQDIRLTIARTNWEQLTPEQQEEVIVDIEIEFNKLTEEQKQNTYRLYSCGPNSSIYRQMKNIINPLLQKALLDRNESVSLRYVNIIGLSGPILTHINNTELIQIFKDMPNIFRIYWNTSNKFDRRADTILAHPDSIVRMEEVKRILSKFTYVKDLDDWRRAIKIWGRENLKGKILLRWMADSSISIRRYIALNTTNVEVLEKLSLDDSLEISQIACPRCKKFQKRAKYSKAYQEKKNSN